MVLAGLRANTHFPCLLYYTQLARPHGLLGTRCYRAFAATASSSARSACTISDSSFTFRCHAACSSSLHKRLHGELLQTSRKQDVDAARWTEKQRQEPHQSSPVCLARAVCSKSSERDRKSASFSCRRWRWQRQRWVRLLMADDVAAEQASHFGRRRRSVFRPFRLHYRGHLLDLALPRRDVVIPARAMTLCTGSGNQYNVMHSTSGVRRPGFACAAAPVVSGLLRCLAPRQRLLKIARTGSEVCEFQLPAKWQPRWRHSVDSDYFVVMEMVA